ncbi:uncharacterized protein KY384_002153 [Bacidia gigantensis]|uniref:uncharacterized protein n=1 Tax=Bacidia gigantensis TaxID=2732470 RepID=UPI001D0550AA|nr:uncharacterized protein KY384_002153 [Bacidia gigantensis]KAG8533370.1 hypothetical protein KY384_002153 [Bacidia gigantensis]
MPPTPATSTDITGKNDAHKPPPNQLFDLPPPALTSLQNSTPNASGHRPIQPAGASAYSLPPPPTRSRTIIQMTPKSLPKDDEIPARQSFPKASSKRGRTSSGAATAPKKQPSSTSAAGRKIARKTAHSVIERRRRSKMNEEFGTLKDMIPACSGQDMHKLAILQASIDYLRYLEACITDLKAANNALSTPLVQPQAPSLRDDHDATDSSDDEEEDEEPTNAVGKESGPMEGVNHHNVIPTEPSNIQPTAMYTPQSSINSPDDSNQTQRHRSSYTSSMSSLPSPLFGPHRRLQSQHSTSAYSSASLVTSPTIVPNSEQDEEATAALLMLTNDRRHLPSPTKVKKGLSVKDLLTH